MSNLLINIPNEERVDGASPDSVKYHKDCDDFVCLDDGTIIRECKYCNLSLVCRQIDILPNGKEMPMEGNILPVYNDKGELVEHEIFCTGMYDLRSLKERLNDEKAS
jgi:hypothetical protein